MQLIWCWIVRFSHLRMNVTGFEDGGWKMFTLSYDLLPSCVYWRRKRKRGWVKQFSTPSASWPRRSKYIRGSMKQLSTLYSVRKVQVAPARKSRSMLARHFNRNALLRSWRIERRCRTLVRIAPALCWAAHARTLSTAVDKENPFTDWRWGRYSIVTGNDARSSKPVGFILEWENRTIQRQMNCIFTQTNWLKILHL